MEFHSTQTVYEKALSMTAEQREAALLETKIANTEVVDPPTMPITKELFTFIRSILHDTPKIGTYDERSEILTLRYMSKELLHQFRLKDQFVPGIGTYAESIYELAKKQLIAKEALARAGLDAVTIRMQKREDILLQVEVWLRQSAEDARRMRLPAKPFRKFDANDFSTWACLNLEDAETSKSNLLTKNSQLRKSVRIDKVAIEKLNQEKKPLVAELADLLAKLNHPDLTESDYKDLKLSIDFRQDKVDKILEKVTLLEDELADFSYQILENESKIKVLNLVIDSYQLRIDLENFKNRKVRTLQRVRKTLREMAKLETLRTNLNDAWLDSTSSPDELVEPLNLKASAELYFI